jgi:hypothetical protein
MTPARGGAALAAMRAGIALAAIMALPWPKVSAAATPPASSGESVYRLGVTGSGKPLAGSRDAGFRVEGETAACINCHQRSGLGGREGHILIPPIAGRYLFDPNGAAGKNPDLPYVEGMRVGRGPYSDAALARAIRDGVDLEGNTLNYLMPRYALDDGDMAALIGYLRTLDRGPVPGLTESALHFATIVTPDADPVKRRGMLDVLRQFFVDRNVRQFGPAPRILSSGKTIYAHTTLMAHRRWELHVWELTGAPADWQRQLEEHLAREPVFAVLSGLGGSNWAPVHAFCERSGVPCLFPNVEVPVDRERDFYSVYFSKGVLLEAELIARRLATGGAAINSVTQIYREGDSGAAGAAALAQSLAESGVKVVSEVLPPGKSGAGLAKALHSAADAGAIVLWLRPDDVAALGPAPGASQAVFLSGLMGGLERAPLPAGWREHTLLAYPVDLPDRRRVRVDFALGWFRLRKIPVVDLPVQEDTYLACGLLAEMLSQVVDTLGRDYLIERMQMMLDRRILTGYYPRLSIASRQRFASKGGFLVRFTAPTGDAVAPVGVWTVP